MGTSVHFLSLPLFLFFFFSFIFISWRLIALQYCSGFCRTLTWISHGFTSIPHSDPPSHLPLHPWVFPVHQALAPVSCTFKSSSEWVDLLMFSWDEERRRNSNPSKPFWAKVYFPACIEICCGWWGDVCLWRVVVGDWLVKECCFLAFSLCI